MHLAERGTKGISQEEKILVYVKAEAQNVEIVKLLGLGNMEMAMSQIIASLCGTLNAK